jgi:hypothetical protein
MLGKACILGFGVSLAIAVSTLSAAAQDTPVDATTKAPATSAQPAPNDTSALAKATQNPVASLIRFRCRTTAILASGLTTEQGISSIFSR